MGVGGRESIGDGQGGVDEQDEGGVGVGGRDSIADGRGGVDERDEGGVHR